MRYQKVLRHGNSLVVVLPAAVARELDIQRGDSVSLAVIEYERIDGVPARFGVEIWPVVEEGKPIRIKIDD